MADEHSESREKTREPPPVEFIKPGEAQAPLPPRDQPAAWVPRPEDYQRPTAPWTPAAGPARPSNLPTAAGILLILAGVLGIVAALVAALNLPSVSDYANYTNASRNSPELIAFFQICGVLSIWSQGLAVLGGVMAYMRVNWRLTLVCAAFSILTLGFAFEASLLGTLGLVFVLISRRSFRS
jgi:hypothetical protein